MAQYIEQEWLDTQTCATCGVLFAMPSHFVEKRRQDKKSFYCPNGHSLVFRGKSDAEVLREQLSRKEADLARANQKLDGVSRSYKRMRKRIASGVCPCCNRTFQNLLNHMKTQHPDFSSNKTLKVLRESYGLTQTQLSKEIGVHSVYISNYEHQKPVSVAAAQRIEQWIGQQGAA